MKAHTPPKAEIKIFALAAPALSDNMIAGAANVTGILDQADDVIFPGFFTPVLADFLKNGFVPVGHAWEGLPIAYPSLAEERGNQLYSEAVFHSTQAAQDARIVSQERIAAGKSVGLSVGFLCADDGMQWFKNGQALLDYAAKNGSDLSLFDQVGIAAHKRTCRGLTKCAKLYEWSIVAAPCNTSAVASTVKGETVGMPTNPNPANLNPAFPSLYHRLQLVLAQKADHTGLMLKGDALGNVEQDASMAALRTVNSTLMRVVYQALYNPADEVATIEDLLDGLPAAFDEARDLSLSLLRALLADVDIEDLRQDLEYWYYYYSAPPGEQAALTFAHKAAHLETDVAAFVTLATRRQEARVKEGRKLSQATREKMQAIHDGLIAHCDSLKTLLAETDVTTNETDPVPLPAPVALCATNPTRQNADRLLRELQCLATTWHTEN